MNKSTGEILPSAQALRVFYASHPWNADWTEEWEETGLEVEDSFLPPPDFTKAVSAKSNGKEVLSHGHPDRLSGR